MISLLFALSFLISVSQACFPTKAPSEARIPVAPCRKCAKDSFYKENYQCTSMYDGIQGEQACQITPASAAMSYNTVNGCSAVTLMCPAGSSYYVNSKLFDNQPDPKQVFSEEIFKALTPVISCGSDSKWKIDILGENEQHDLDELACYKKVSCRCGFLPIEGTNCPAGFDCTNFTILLAQSSTGECTKVVFGCSAGNVILSFGGTAGAYLSVASANDPSPDLGIVCRDGLWKYLDIENKYYNVPIQSVMCGKPK